MPLTPQKVMQLVNRYIGVSGGYLGDFSYRTHAEFYPEYCDITDIDPDEYIGTTRARFTEILSSQPANRQAKIFRGVLERFPIESADSDRARFQSQIAAWISELDAEPVVANPTLPADTSEVVRRALADSENLIRTSGPASAVDRVHTALHGHLRSLCAAENIILQDSATLQVAMKRLRENHPRLQPTGARAEDLSRVLYSMASTLDALTTLRNNASAAHPNEVLLDDPEALLAINAGRTIFTFIDQKLRGPSSTQNLTGTSVVLSTKAPF